ncbi:MAG: hypothetical protein ACOYBD_11835 [Bilifractor sp.]
MNTILEILEETAKGRPDAPTVTDPSDSRTYRRLVDDARRAGQRIQEPFQRGEICIGGETVCVIEELIH